MDEIEAYQPFFDHIAKEHGLTLTQSEMDEIIKIVDEMKSNNEMTKLS